MQNNEVYSLAAINRMPNYLRYLYELKFQGIEYVTAGDIASVMGLTPVLVKKDLNPILSHNGKPRVGHNVENLIQDLKKYLGYDKIKNAVIIGTGRLGQALISYQGFTNYGINIIMGFDNNPFLIGKRINNVEVFSLDKAKELIKKFDVDIGIITVPREFAQEVADLLIESGVKGIWNWAPTHINIPSEVALKNEDIASSLAILTNNMKHRSDKE